MYKYKFIQAFPCTIFLSDISESCCYNAQRPKYLKVPRAQQTPPFRYNLISKTQCSFCLGLCPHPQRFPHHIRDKNSNYFKPCIYYR